MDAVLDDILDCLLYFSCTNDISDMADLRRAIDGGPQNVLYTTAVAALCSQLKQYCGLVETVHTTSSAEDADTFLLETSAFLKELQCPLSFLYEGPRNQRLQTLEQRTQLLDYLCTELQAAYMQQMHSEATKKASPNAVAESPSAQCLKAMLIAVGFPKPPDKITSAQLFAKLEQRVKEQMAKLPSDSTSKPILPHKLNPEQWKYLERLNENMNAEYRMRADMLLKRLDVTIQSFTWSDRIKRPSLIPNHKEKEAELESIYNPLRKKLTPENAITIGDLLAACDDLLWIEKTCSVAVRANTNSNLQKLLMGQVPDRGGRPTEIEPPAANMPTWSKRTSGGGQHHRGRGGGPRGHRGGGRVQGAGWSANQGDAGNWTARDTPYQRQQSSGGGRNDRGGHQPAGGYWCDNGNYQEQGYGYGDDAGYYQQGGGGGYDNRRRGRSRGRGRY